MKAYILYIGLFLFLLFGCEENDRMTFVGKPGVYFEDYKNEDTIKYSFNMTPYDKDTLWIGIKLMGVPLSESQSFRLDVTSASTAVAGVHYEEFPAVIDFPLYAVDMQLPLILTDKDESLDASSVFLQLKLRASENMDIGFPGNTVLNVSITNMLVKPEYWNNNFVSWFGEYSKVKHEKCIEMMGHDFPLTYEEAYYWQSETANLNYWMFMGRKLADYFAKTPTRDENGNWISVWEPA